MTSQAGAPAPERLRSIPVFSALDDETLERISTVAAEVEFPRGQVLIEPRQPASGVFFIVDGQVDVDLRSGRVRLGAGECVGELSILVDDAARSARVCAATPVRCVAIPRGQFEDLLQAEPAFTVGIARELARRLLERVPR